MAVTLSRKAGHFTIVLPEVRWLDVSGVAPRLAAALRVTKSDAARMLRQQKGILAQGVGEEAAHAAVSTLQEAQVPARAVRDDEVPALPKALEIALIRIGEHDFETPSVVGAGLPQIWPWDSLLLACGGIIVDSTIQIGKLTSTLEGMTSDEADVRKAHARRQLERARERVFPLGSEVRKAEPELGETLSASARAKSGSKAKPEPADEFDNVKTVIDLLFSKPLERLRITAKTRVQDLPRSVHPAKQLHIIAAALQPHLGNRGCNALAALAAGTDSGSYLFEDLVQFDDYCRWCFMHRNE